MSIANDTQRQLAHLKADQLAAARAIQRIAMELDYLKNPNEPRDPQRAQQHIDTLHDIAARLAGEHAQELYGTEDETDALRIAIAAGTACCSGEGVAWPGWSAAEGVMA